MLSAIRSTFLRTAAVDREFLTLSQAAVRKDLWPALEMYRAFSLIGLGAAVLLLLAERVIEIPGMALTSMLGAAALISGAWLAFRVYSSVRDKVPLFQAAAACCVVLFLAVLKIRPEEVIGLAVVLAGVHVLLTAAIVFSALAVVVSSRQAALLRSILG